MIKKQAQWFYVRLLAGFLLFAIAGCDEATTSIGGEPLRPPPEETVGGTPGTDPGTDPGEEPEPGALSGQCIADFNYDDAPDVFVLGGDIVFDDTFWATLPPGLNGQYAALDTLPPDGSAHLWLSVSGGFTDARDDWGIALAHEAGSVVDCPDIDADLLPDIQVHGPDPLTPAIVYLNPLPPAPLEFMPEDTDIPARIALALDYLDRGDLRYEVIHAAVIINLRDRFGLVMENDLTVTVDTILGLMQTLGYDDLWRRTKQWRRVYDGSNPPETDLLDGLLGDVDDLTMPAAYCDVHPLPTDYPDRIASALTSGEGYQITHVLLAELFLRSNNCTSPLTENDYQSLLGSVRGVVDFTDGEVNDLDIEAMAWLVAAGRPDLLPEDALDTVLTVQREDGAWLWTVELASGGMGMASDHSTALGLWLLLGLQYPDMNAGPLLPAGILPP